MIDLKRLVGATLSLVFVISVLSDAAWGDAESCEPHWIETFSGSNAADGPVHALTVFDDGSGPALYAGGDFGHAGGQPAGGIARWDGNTWTTLGAGSNGTVFGLTVFDDGSGPALYAGGEFTEMSGVPANGIAKWDGVSWTAVGLGVDGWIRSMQVYDDGEGPALYVGGLFQTAGGAEALNIAKWDGASWHEVGGGANGGVVAMGIYDDGMGGGEQLYIGGWFIHVGGMHMERLARWNGESWSFLGHVGGTVRAIMEFDASEEASGALYVAGQVHIVDGLKVSGIAEWSGGGWTAPGVGMTGHQFHQISALCRYDDGTGGGEALYAGGSFSTAGGSAAQGVAKWNGLAWSALGAGIVPVAWYEQVDAIAVFDDGHGADLYFAGTFTESPNDDDFLARWGGCNATPVVGDLNGDGVVTVADLLALLGAWGPCGEACDGADLNGDEIVDVLDLLVMIANWGA